jgi:hypothetical protein
VTNNLTAEPMAPLNGHTDAQQLALLVLLSGPLYLHGSENCWKPGDTRLVLGVKQTTIDALERRGSVYLGREIRAGKSWQVAKLTPKGGWYARTVQRKHELAAASMRRVEAHRTLVPRMLTPSIQPLGANDA